MTRRILVMLLAFTALVLVGAVVPLTLNATSHDRNSFIQAAAGMARTDAVVVQSLLSLLNMEAASAKYKPSAQETAQAFAGKLQVVREAREAGDGVLVLTAAGDPVAQTAMPAGNWPLLGLQANDEAQRVLGSNDEAIQPITETAGQYVVVAMPVYNGSQWIGAVVLARSTRPLDHEIAGLWVILGSVAVVAMILAVLLGFGLARWVSRPLKGLDAAAQRLADGDLAIRAKVGSGPPELRRLGTTFNTMAGRLEALVHGSRAMIADVSHQLRTPLAALRLRLDLLAADTDPDTGHELAGALDELARLSRLVDGLLTVARAEGVVPVPTAVDVAAVAEERVVAWHPVADDRGITLASAQQLPSAGLGRAVSRDPAGPVLAWIGEGHLEQILDNLIANALEALSPGSLVRLTVEVTATGARIAVRDNGPGMSAEDRERAFLRFTTSSPNGTGLGLAIVHRLAVSNGGTARLDETPGGGLTVTIDFPGVPKSTANGSTGAAVTPAPAPAGL